MTDATISTSGFEQDPFALAYPETREFWAAAAEQRFVIKACKDCGRAHWFPRVICPLCGSANTVWQSASGRGTIYAFSAARKAAPAYTLAYVTLEEGPTLMTNLIGAAPESFAIGQAVSLCWVTAPEGRMMPYFAP